MKIYNKIQSILHTFYEIYITWKVTILHTLYSGKIRAKVKVENRTKTDSLYYPILWT